MIGHTSGAKLSNPVDPYQLRADCADGNGRGTWPVPVTSVCTKGVGWMRVPRPCGRRRLRPWYCRSARFMGDRS